MFGWVNPGRWVDGWMGDSVGEWVVDECLDGWLCGWMHAYVDVFKNQRLDERYFGALEAVPIPMLTRNLLNDFQGLQSTLGFCFPMNLTMFFRPPWSFSLIPSAVQCLPSADAPALPHLSSPSWGTLNYLWRSSPISPAPCPLAHLLLPLCPHFIRGPHYLVLKPSVSCFSSWERETSQRPPCVPTFDIHPAQSRLWELNWFPGSACFDVF